MVDNSGIVPMNRFDAEEKKRHDQQKKRFNNGINSIRPYLSTNPTFKNPLKNPTSYLGHNFLQIPLLI